MSGRRRRARAARAPGAELMASLLFAVEKSPSEDKEKDISKLVSGIVKCSINRQISYKTVGPSEVRVHVGVSVGGGLRVSLNGEADARGLDPGALGSSCNTCHRQQDANVRLRAAFIAASVVVAGGPAPSPAG